MSKTQFPLPKGVEINNIEIDVKNNLLTIVYEEEKPVLKVGEWYNTGLNYELVIDQDLRSVGFTPNGWSGANAMTLNRDANWKLADMKEVEKLLINMCVNKYKDAKKVCCPHRDPHFDVDLSNLKCWFNEHCVRVYMPGTYDPDLFCIHFDVGNGKSEISWAEIIPEKKPLYVNAYGTEFFEGDDFWYVNKRNLQFWNVKNSHKDYFGEDDEGSELLTKRECYRYINEHWDELNK